MSSKAVSLATGAVILAALALAFSVGASTARRPAPPEPVIALVDLTRVLDGLTERSERERAHKDRVERFQKELDTLQKQIEDDRSKLEYAKPEDKPAIRESIALLEFRLDAQARASKAILEHYRGQAMSELYVKITTAAAELAQQSGYTLVLASDEDAPPPSASADEVIQAAVLRRVLYADDGHDITQELIDFMNNRYAAAAGG